VENVTAGGKFEVDRSMGRLSQAALCVLSWSR